MNLETNTVKQTTYRRTVDGHWIRGSCGDSLVFTWLSGSSGENGDRSSRVGPDHQENDTGPEPHEQEQQGKAEEDPDQLAHRCEFSRCMGFSSDEAQEEDNEYNQQPIDEYAGHCRNSLEISMRNVST